MDTILYILGAVFWLYVLGIFFDQM